MVLRWILAQAAEAGKGSEGHSYGQVCAADTPALTPLTCAGRRIVVRAVVAPPMVVPLLAAPVTAVAASADSPTVVSGGFQTPGTGSGQSALGNCSTMPAS